MTVKPGLAKGVYAAIGLAAVAFGALLTLGWLASFHPLVAAGGVAVGAVVLAGVLRDAFSPSRTRFGRLRAVVGAYEGLVQAGREGLRDVGHMAQIALVVAGWLIVGLLVALAFLLPGIVLGPDGPLAMLGMLGLWGFFACLVIGPLVTLRWLWRR